MKKSVGLVVVTSVPGENGNEVHAVVIQRRGMWNMEKNQPESYPGCCQVTVRGKLEGEENFMEGLLREGREELGRSFAELLQSLRLNMTPLVRKIKEKEEVVTFGVFVGYDDLHAIRLGPESGGLDIVKISEVQKQDGLIEITPEMKVAGCPPNVRAMFADEIEAVKKAFEFIKPQPSGGR